MRTTALEALEAKSGHLHTVADWRVAGEKDPADMTELDLAIIDYFDGAKAAAASRDARTKALAPPVVETKAIPVPAATPASNVAHLPTLDDADDLSTDAGLDVWAEENAMAAVPVLIWRGFVKSAREKRQQLEARIAQLEGKPHVKFCGVWKAGAYQPGDAATHHGGLWICKAATSGEPSQDFVGWTLAVKQGAAR